MIKFSPGVIGSAPSFALNSTNQVICSLDLFGLNWYVGVTNFGTIDGEASFEVRQAERSM